MPASPVVVVSGVHSGPNPSPGVGVARSLRLAWPGASLHAVDYSTESTGLSSVEFDRVHVLPPWHTVELSASAADLAALVADLAAVLVPGLDLEAELLSEPAAGDHRLLLPPPGAFATIRKPATLAAEVLGLRVPRFEVVADAAAASAFAESTGWRVWVKGSRYEAVGVRDRLRLVDALESVRATWGDTEVLVQEHVEGDEESLVFAALEGRLLGACRMGKTMVTPEGKTWAGRVREPTGAELDRLADFVERTAWTGGGEVEMVREAATGERHLIEVNPRFPAWVHGATIAGVNLPARLVAAATGLPPEVEEKAERAAFVRVVHEIPARFESGSTPRGHRQGRSVAAKHPSAMPALSRRRSAERRDAAPEPVDRPYDPAVTDEADTPLRLLREDVLTESVAAVEGVLAAVELATGVPGRFAYSVKTNPDGRVLDAVERAGGLAEVISQGEAARAVGAGFHPDRLVLNGPAKWWRFTGNRAAYGAVFADSVVDLERTLDLVERGVVTAATLGVRVAPPGARSRFGVDLSDRSEFLALVRVLRRCRVPVTGVHFHHAASRTGARAWVREATSAVDLARTAFERGGHDHDLLDLGGGWPSGFPVHEYAAAVSEVVASVPAGALRGVVVEPGKFLVERCMSVLATVLEVRRSRGHAAAVVDASVAELPDWLSHVHPVLWRHGDRWFRLGAGSGRVHGRLCMEHDVLHEAVGLPDRLERGDRLLFLNAGAYDASMSYRFGV
ncbi:hypothetical protein [Actinosynnema sp. NPDC020468]|uniref:hypothetical protein n=1 Tax=Actinosynnema sp. NPDC020468 TaxID=3154488 RepID=UPI003406D41F